MQLVPFSFLIKEFLYWTYIWKRNHLQTVIAIKIYNCEDVQVIADDSRTY